MSTVLQVAGLCIYVATAWLTASVAAGAFRDATRWPPLACVVLGCLFGATWPVTYLIVLTVMYLKRRKESKS